MAQRRHELDTRILTILFLAAAPFLAFGAYLIVGLARGRLEDSLGESLERRALQAKLSIERYMGEQIVVLHLLALDPEVVAVASAGPAPKSAKADQSLSRRLREILQIRPNLKLLQVVDSQGRVTAASARDTRIVPGPPRQEALLGDDPTLRAYVGDVERAPGTESAVLEIDYPIHDLEGRPQGLVRALLDAADLYGVLASIRIGHTGHASLVRADDGLILASDEQQQVLRDRFAGFATIQAAIVEKRGYWLIPEVPERPDGATKQPGEPARLVGFALVDQVPDVNWLVTVEQDQEEAIAPLTGVTRYLWIHFAFVAGAVILLALYFSFKLEEPVIEEGLHLHEEHVPASMKVEAP